MTERLALALMVFLITLFGAAAVALFFPGIPPNIRVYLPAAAIVTGIALFAILAQRSMKKIRTAKDENEPEPITPRDHRISAVHESGHAIVIAALGQAEKIQRVSIGSYVKGDGTLAFVQYETSSNLISTKEDVLDLICVCLGGRCAEELVLNEISDGASQDLAHASSLANHMIRDLGMSAMFPNRQFDEENAPSGGKTKYIIDLEIQQILNDCTARATLILEFNREILDEMFLYLLDYDELAGEELEKILSSVISPFGSLNANDKN